MNKAFQNYSDVLKKYTLFTGRAERPEYWYFILINVIISIILNIIDKNGFLGTLYMLAILSPSIGVTIRRLHDTGKSGWWILISLIPILGMIVLIVFLATEGQTGKNQYGENPRKTIQTQAKV